MLRIIKRFNRQEWFHFATIQVFVLLQIVTDISIPVLFGSLTHLIPQTINNPSQTYEVLIYAVIMVILVLFGLFLGSVGNVLAHRKSIDIVFGLRQELVSKIQTFNFFDLNQFPVSSLVTRITDDVDNIRLSFYWFIRVLSRGFLLFFGSFIAIIIVFYAPGINVEAAKTVHDQRYLLIILLSAFVVIMGIILVFSGIKQRHFFKKWTQSLDKVNGLFRENILGVRLIKSFNLQTSQVNRFEHLNKKLGQEYYPSATWSSIMGPIFTTIMNILIIALVWLAIVLNAISVGIVFVLIQILSLMSVGIAITLVVLISLFKSRSNVRRVYEILDYNSKIQRASNIQKLDHFDIKLRDVSFKYYDKSSVNYAVDQINLSIKPGQKIGIIGPIGSGKSTLANLIAGNYLPSQGQVLIGGHATDTIDVRYLHTQLVLNFQTPHLFEGTIASNLKFANPNASLNEMWTALEHASLASFVQAQKAGLAYRIAQKGSNLSGGQRQRLSIARALLIKSKVLILDDSTSALDVVTEKKLLTELKKVPDRTLILVTQKISNIFDADQIIVLEEGRISAVGTHSNLISTSPYYQELANLQLTKRQIYETTKTA